MDSHKPIFNRENPFSLENIQHDSIRNKTESHMRPNIAISLFSGNESEKLIANMTLSYSNLLKISKTSRQFDNFEDGAWTEPKVNYTGVGFCDLFSAVPEISNVKYVIFSNNKSGFCMTLTTAFRLDPFIFTAVEKPGVSLEALKPQAQQGLVLESGGRTFGISPLLRISSANELPKSAKLIVPIIRKSSVPRIELFRNDKKESVYSQSDKKESLHSKIWHFAFRKIIARKSLPMPKPKIVKIVRKF